EAPADKKRHQRQAEPQQAGVATAETVTQNAENRPEKRAAEQRDCGQQALLSGAEVHLLAEKRSQRTEQYPHHEAHVEVEERGDQSRKVARVEKLLRNHSTLLESLKIRAKESSDFSHRQRLRRAAPSAPCKARAKCPTSAPQPRFRRARSLRARRRNRS